MPALAKQGMVLDCAAQGFAFKSSEPAVQLIRLDEVASAVEEQSRVFVVQEIPLGDKPEDKEDKEVQIPLEFQEFSDIFDERAALT